MQQIPHISYKSLLTETYAYCDPASGTTQVKRASQARTAFCVVACDPLARVFVLYHFADRITPSAIVEKVKEIQLTYAPALFGIEANAQQSLFAGVLEHDLLKDHVAINLEYVHSSTQINKLERIRSIIQPLSRSGRLFLQASDRHLVEEIRAFPTGPTVDSVDALAGAISLIPPRKLTRHTQHTSAIADYLTRLGRPDLVPHYTHYTPYDPSKN